MKTSDRLKQLREHQAEIENQLSEPDVASDQKRMSQLGREHARLQETINVAKQLADAESRLEQAEEILRTERDANMRELAEAEREEAERLTEDLSDQLQMRLLPPDPLDERNILLEIRAGTGGEE